jgi:pyruvate,water dikinase
VAEVFPDQLAPQVLDVYVDLLNTGERLFFGRLMAHEKDLGPVIKAFHGRLYLNLSQLRHVVACVGVPFAGTLRSLGHPEQIHPGDELARRPPLMRLLRVVPDIVRLARYDLGMVRVFRAHQARTERALMRLTSRAPDGLSDQDIWATIAWWVDSALQAIPPVFVMSNVQAREDIIRKACERVGTTYDALAYPNLAAGPRSVSSQQAFDLARLAAIARDEPHAAAYFHRDRAGFDDLRVALAGTTFLAEFDAFMTRYGHRGRYESDWSIPRLREDSTPVLFAIRAQMDAPQDVDGMIARQAADAAAAWRAFEARLTAWQRWTLLPRVRTALTQLKRQYIWREQVRSDLTRVLAAVRPWHLALARRFVERGWLDHVDEYFLLLLREVRQACDDPERGQALRPIAARRAVEREAERPLQLPLFMRESELPALMAQRSPAVGAGDELRGFCVSPGRVTAEVVVMRDPDEFATMKRGAILVAPATDPSWTPLFTLAAGVIVEVGGMLSHASTIAREYGLPALANVKNATRILKTGDRVVLDASGGVVRRQSDHAQSDDPTLSESGDRDSARRT